MTRRRTASLREATFDRSFTDPVADPLPSDYEPCSDCGYDHSYEQAEAKRWHARHTKSEDAELQERAVLGRAAPGPIRRLVMQEVRRALVEGPRGNPQSEPEFGSLLDALISLRGKGFRPDEVMRTAMDLLIADSRKSRKTQ